MALSFDQISLDGCAANANPGIGKQFQSLHRESGLEFGWHNHLRIASDVRKGGKGNKSEHVSRPLLVHANAGIAQACYLNQGERINDNSGYDSRNVKNRCALSVEDADCFHI